MGGRPACVRCAASIWLHTQGMVTAWLRGRRCARPACAPGIGRVGPRGRAELDEGCRPAWPGRRKGDPWRSSRSSRGTCRLPDTRRGLASWARTAWGAYRYSPSTAAPATPTGTCAPSTSSPASTTARSSTTTRLAAAAPRRPPTPTCGAPSSSRRSSWPCAATWASSTCTCWARAGAACSSCSTPRTARAAWRRWWWRARRQTRTCGSPRRFACAPTCPARWRRRLPRQTSTATTTAQRSRLRAPSTTAATWPRCPRTSVPSSGASPSPTPWATRSTTRCRA